MSAVRDYLRMGLAGLLLEPAAFRAQREAPDRLRRGFLLVTLVGILVGLAGLIGRSGELLATPSRSLLQRTIYDGIIRLPWYIEQVAAAPEFAERFRSRFELAVNLIWLWNGGNLAVAAAGVIITPLLYLAAWVVFGLLAHLVALMLGGRGSLAQTLGCTALASGASLLRLVEVVPFAHVGSADPILLLFNAVVLLSLLAGYFAVRTAHQLPVWPAVWATLLGPLVLGVLTAIIGCFGLLVAVALI